MFNPDGVIRASTQEEELGKDVGDVEFFLKNRYFIKEEMVNERSEGKRREKVYYFNSPILNHPECFQCHDSKKKIIGILTVANTLRDMDREISKVKKDAIIIAITTISILSTILGFLFLRFVNVPITKLTDTMRRVEEGDLDVRVEIRSRDEMDFWAKISIQ